ncbi:hypothetical protein MTO96_020368 [Rhipicephalus appendiculatus]
MTDRPSCASGLSALLHCPPSFEASLCLPSRTTPRVFLAFPFSPRARAYIAVLFWAGEFSAPEAFNISSAHIKDADEERERDVRWLWKAEHWPDMRIRDSEAPLLAPRLRPPSRASRSRAGARGALPTQPCEAGCTAERARSAAADVFAVRAKLLRAAAARADTAVSYSPLFRRPNSPLICVFA